MPEILDLIDFKTKDFEYLPLKAMIEQLAEKAVTTYPSKFSFTPYVKSLEGKISPACDFTKSAMAPVLQNYAKYIEDEELTLEELTKSEHFSAIAQVAVPSMFFKNSLNFISTPFTKDFLLLTESLQTLVNDPNWEMKMNTEKLLHLQSNMVKEIHLFLLHKIYGKEQDKILQEVFTLRNKKSNVSKHYQIKKQLDFIEVKVSGVLPHLAENKINDLVNDLSNQKLWQEYFPTDQISLEGFGLGSWSDVTEIEIQAELKQYLIDIENETKPGDFKKDVSEYIGSFLNKPCVEVGTIVIDPRNNGKNQTLSLSGYTGAKFLKKKLDDTFLTSVYRQVLEDKTTVYIDDIAKANTKGSMLSKVYKNGIKSLVLHPTLDEDNNVQSIFEIGSQKEFAFNNLTVQKLEKIFDLLDQSYARFMVNLENQISKIVKEKFTAIHPSVEWRFEEAATDYYTEGLENVEASIKPVVFHDLIPLYGQADIVGSSSIRNVAIKNDLITNLEHLILMLDQWIKRKPLHVLRKCKIRVEKDLAKIKNNYTSRDENGVVDLLTKEVHPMLKQYAKRYKELPKRAYKKYLDTLDPDLDIVYNERKSFEDSVMMLNLGISNLIEKEDVKLQSVLPHYFEKYKTDGVEYNLYLGQELLKDDKFNDFDLKEFKIWQLVNMCEIVKYVDSLATQMAFPLTTAQLIFVYNSPISISFRMDEKRFDVDGTYNVRYEILKKRIDKAIIKGTNKRLTVSGKIAIVYLSESDKLEYLGFLDYLKSNDLIEDEIEDLDLEKMQGAEGLKALRVKVKI